MLLLLLSMSAYLHTFENAIFARFGSIILYIFAVASVSLCCCVLQVMVLPQSTWIVCGKSLDPLNGINIHLRVYHSNELFNSYCITCILFLIPNLSIMLLSMMQVNIHFLVTTVSIAQYPLSGRSKDLLLRMYA